MILVMMATSFVVVGIARQVGRNRVPMYAYEEIDSSKPGLFAKKTCFGRLKYKVTHAFDVSTVCAFVPKTQRSNMSKIACIIAATALYIDPTLEQSDANRRHLYCYTYQILLKV